MLIRFDEDIKAMQTQSMSSAIMPVVRTEGDDGRLIEAPQFALDNGFSGDSCLKAFSIRHLMHYRFASA